MLAAGDFDMMRPLFGMYLDTLPLQKERTRRYFDHDGAYYPETMSFWGLSRDEDYGVGNVRKGKPASWHLNGFIRREWQGAIELIAMMLDHYEHTGDDEVLGRELLPLATAVLTFCDLHYKRGADGKIRFEPAQALETWWECVDPMPEIAGLTNVLPRLLQLPAQAVDDDERARWERLLEQLPDLPTREHGGQTVLSPARVFAVKNNCENPELYAIFPYRLFGVQRPRLDMARNSMHLRLATGRHAAGHARTHGRSAPIRRAPRRDQLPGGTISGLLGPQLRLDPRPGPRRQSAHGTADHAPAARW
jgi:hypothetical protein